MKLDTKSTKNTNQAKKFFSVLATIFYLMLAFMILQNWHKLTSSIFVAFSSEETTGTLIEGKPQKFSDGRRAENDRYTIKYSFTVSGKEYAGSDEVSARNSITNQSIAIKYNPNNPAYSQTKDSFYQPVFVGSLLGVLVSSLFAMICFYLYIKGRRRLYKNLTIILLLFFTLLGLNVIMYSSTF